MAKLTGFPFPCSIELASILKLAKDILMKGIQRMGAEGHIPIQRFMHEVGSVQPPEAAELALVLCQRLGRFSRAGACWAEPPKEEGPVEE